MKNTKFIKYFVIILVLSVFLFTGIIAFNIIKSKIDENNMEWELYRIHKSQSEYEWENYYKRKNLDNQPIIEQPPKEEVVKSQPSIIVRKQATIIVENEYSMNDSE